jgi:hypothetical protein
VRRSGLLPFRARRSDLRVLSEQCYDAYCNSDQYDPAIGPKR